jgi:phosphate transport system ATP-binding protein
VAEAEVKFRVEQLSCWLSGAQVLYGASLSIPRCQVTALIGRSGSGKSTFLRCLNRLNDLLDGARVTGRVLLDGADIYAPETDLAALRRRVGLVLQTNTVFPGSVLDNLAWAPKLHGARDMERLRVQARQCLEQAALWDEVAARLDAPAQSLSGGQQQRLCIARALMLAPEVLLMDEPLAALDVHAAAQVEELIGRLRAQYTVVVVTHDLRLAQRLDGMAAVFDAGRIVEAGPAGQLLQQPQQPETRVYLAGGSGAGAAAG